MVIEQLMQWFDIPFLIWTRDVEVSHLESYDGSEAVTVYIYTNTNKYSIRAVVGDKSYLGCVASARTPRAGEDWTRGNDLPDGKFCQETFDNIMKAIVGYEVVKVHRPVEREGGIAQDTTPDSPPISETALDRE